MSLRGGGGWGAEGQRYSITKQLASYMNSLSRPFLWSFSTYCNPFKMLPNSVPDINIHLARGFQPVGYFSASTRAI